MYKHGCFPRVFTYSDLYPNFFDYIFLKAEDSLSIPDLTSAIIKSKKVFDCKKGNVVWLRTEARKTFIKNIMVKMTISGKPSNIHICLQYRKRPRS